MFSVILVTLMLVMLVLARSMPFAPHALSVLFVLLWMIALLYFVVRRW